ncbi:alpha/beta hydrolase [Cereibacter sphaeroides]|uniref:alpha/beta hydrolase n=1 Tax=Cereibacter sphaeroides TaxID=1063 RepID=UPI0039A313B5
MPDPSGPAFPAQAKAFGALPATGFGERPVLAVASENDPYDPKASAIAWAARQGAWPRRLGPRGHLNEASNLGAWPEGQGLLADFLDEIGE